MNSTWIGFLNTLRQIVFFIKQAFFVWLKIAISIGVVYAFIMVALPHVMDVWDDYKRDQAVCEILGKDQLKGLLKDHYSNTVVTQTLKSEWIDAKAKRINLRNIKVGREALPFKTCQSVYVELFTVEDMQYKYYVYPRAKDTGEAVFGEYNNSAANIYITNLNGVDYLVGIAKAD